MFGWSKLNQTLEKFSAQHARLLSRFEFFAQQIAESMQSPSYPIKGIKIDSYLGDGNLFINIGGRRICLSLSSALDADDQVCGKIICTLHKSPSSNESTKITEITLTPSGKTNLVEPDEKDDVIIDHDIPAKYVALHFIYACLKHESIKR